MTEQEIKDLSLKLAAARTLQSKIKSIEGRINALGYRLNFGTTEIDLSRLEGEKHYKYFLGENATEDDIKRLAKTAVDILTDKKAELAKELERL